MKQKIKEALKQKYGTRANKELGQLQLGIGDEVFERVAASVETFITDESAIEGFVNSENTLNLLKSYQSVNDRLRTYEKKPKPEQKTPDDGNNQPEEKPETKPQENPVDMAKVIAEAVANAIKPIREEFAEFKAEKTVSETIAAVNTRIEAWGYGKGFPKEMEKARKNAMELYEAYGKKWTADELEAKIKEKFNQEVYDKGLDTTKPYESDGGADGDETFDSDFFTNLYKGKVAGENKPE